MSRRIIIISRATLLIRASSKRVFHTWISSDSISWPSRTLRLNCSFDNSSRAKFPQFVDMFAYAHFAPNLFSIGIVTIIHLINRYCNVNGVCVHSELVILLYDVNYNNARGNNICLYMSYGLCYFSFFVKTALLALPNVSDA